MSVYRDPADPALRRPSSTRSASVHGGFRAEPAEGVRGRPVHIAILCRGVA